MDDGWHISGMDNLIRMFENLPDVVADKLLKDGVKDAAKIVQQAAKANVTKQSGLLKKSIIVKSKTYGKKGSKTQLAIVGPSKSVTGEYDGKTRTPRYYAHLIEYGFFNKKANRFIKPKAFMRPAYEANKQAMIEAVKARIISGIEQAANEAQR